MAKIILFYSLLGIVSILLLTLVLIPFVVPTILENRSKELVGRSLSLQKMRLNYFNGTISLFHFNLYEKDDSTVFVGFDTLIVNTEPYRLFSKTLVIEDFYLKGFFMDVIMYDSTFNFDDLTELGGDSTTDTVEETSTQSEAMKFEISNMELSDAMFIIQDAEIQDSIEIKDFNFFLPHLSWSQAQESEADLQFNFKNDGYFKSTIDYNPGSGHFNLDFYLGNYDISGYQEFAAKYVDIGKFEGVIDLALKLEGNMEQPTQTTVSSDFYLNDFAVYDQKDSVMLGARQLCIALQEANLSQKKILLDTIRLTEPSIYFEAYDSTNNIAEFMNRIMPTEDSLAQEGVQYETVTTDSVSQGLKEKDKSTEVDTAQQFFVSVNSIQLNDGKIQIADYNHEKSFEYFLSDINVMADSITSNTSWMDVDINMKLNERGKMESEILVDLLNPKEMTLDFTISSLMLEDFDVYCEESTGYPLIYGDMYFKSHTDVRNDTLKSQNNIVVHNIKLGRRHQVIGPPLKFAMFLLKDKNKVVHIDMPIEGPVGESATEVGKLVWDTFSQLLFKVVSTPFKFLGAVFNVFDTDIKRIRYDYLDTTFTAKKERQLNTLLKIEDHGEEVKIDLVYYKDTLLERQQIAMDLVGQEFGGKRGRRNRLEDMARFKKYVERRVKTDTLSLEEACLRLTDRQTIDEISAKLDSARFRSLRNYLHTQKDSTEIMLYYARKSAPNNDDRAPRFEVKLGMKDDAIEEKYIN